MIILSYGFEGIFTHKILQSSRNIGAAISFFLIINKEPGVNLILLRIIEPETRKLYSSEYL